MLAFKIIKFQLLGVSIEISTVLKSLFRVSKSMQ